MQTSKKRGKKISMAANQREKERKKKKKKGKKGENSLDKVHCWRQKANSRHEEQRERTGNKMRERGEDEKKVRCGGLLLFFLVFSLDGKAHSPWAFICTSQTRTPSLFCSLPQTTAAMKVITSQVFGLFVVGVAILALFVGGGQATSKFGCLFFFFSLPLFLLLRVQIRDLIWFMNLTTSQTTIPIPLPSHHYHSHSHFPNHQSLFFCLFHSPQLRLIPNWIQLQ